MLFFRLSLVEELNPKNGNKCNQKQITFICFGQIELRKIDTNTRDLFVHDKLDIFVKYKMKNFLIDSSYQ